MYELLIGFPPFMAVNKKKLTTLIKDTNVVFPDSKRHRDLVLSEDCKDLITRLLQKDPTKRLGCKNGYTGVLAHVWFSDIDINDIQSKKGVSPYKFEINNEDEFEYFNKKYIDSELTHPL